MRLCMACSSMISSYSIVVRIIEKKLKKTEKTVLLRSEISLLLC